MIRKIALCSAALAALAWASPALAQYGADGRRPAGTPELPQCQTPVGTVTIAEPPHQWWTQYNLGSPEDLIKLMASRSNCLKVVDRNAGLAMRGVEKNLGASGDLQRGSNVGAGQIKAADFALIPDLASANSDAGGGTAALGGLLGGRAGSLLGSIQTQRQDARVLLTLVNIRTTEQEYVAEGTAQKTNVSLSGSSFGSTLSALGGGYSNTPMGQIVAAAYLNAFVDMVHHMQGMSAGAGAAAAPIQTYAVRQVTQLHAGASPASPVVRPFNVGDSVFPTGQKNGVWWEVDDETGNRGWVPSPMIAPK